MLTGNSTNAGDDKNTNKRRRTLSKRNRKKNKNNSSFLLAHEPWTPDLNQWRKVNEEKSISLSNAAGMSDTHMLLASVGLRWYEFFFDGEPHYILGRHNCHMCDRPFANIDGGTDRSPLFCMKKGTCPCQDYSPHYARAVCVKCSNKGRHQKGTTIINAHSYKEGQCDLCSFDVAQKHAMENHQECTAEQKQIAENVKYRVEQAISSSITKTSLTYQNIRQIILDRSVIENGKSLEEILIAKKEYVSTDLSFINIDVSVNNTAANDTISMLTSNDNNELLCLWSTRSTEARSIDELKILLRGRAKNVNTVIKQQNIKAQNACGGKFPLDVRSWHKNYILNHQSDSQSGRTPGDFIIGVHSGGRVANQMKALYKHQKYAYFTSYGAGNYARPINNTLFQVLGVEATKQLEQHLSQHALAQHIEFSNAAKSAGNCYSELSGRNVMSTNCYTHTSLVPTKLHYDCEAAETAAQDNNVTRLTALEWGPQISDSKNDRVFFCLRQASKQVIAVRDGHGTFENVQQLLDEAMFIVNSSSSVAPFCLPVVLLKFRKRWHFHCSICDDGSLVFPYIHTSLIQRFILFRASVRAHGTTNEERTETCCYGLAPQWLANEFHGHGGVEKDDVTNSKGEGTEQQSILSSSSTTADITSLGVARRKLNRRNIISFDQLMTLQKGDIFLLGELVSQEKSTEFVWVVRFLQSTSFGFEEQIEIQYIASLTESEKDFQMDFGKIVARDCVSVDNSHLMIWKDVQQEQQMLEGKQ